MPRHTSLREHLVHRAEQDHPVVFVPSNDEPLVEFARLFAATGLYSFDVNKHIPENELWNAFELTVEAVRSPGEAPELMSRYWAPVHAGQDVVTGFHEGPDSALWGSTPADFMPDDENTAALILLVTTNYVHLSASREQTPPLVRGAIDEGGETFRYVVLSESR
jgi:hypothetical protein